MLAGKQKISCRQAILLFIFASGSPAVRLFPEQTAKIAKQAGWLAPLVSSAAFVLLAFIISKIFKGYKDANLADIYYDVMGVFAGKIIISIYLLWVLLLLALYVRYYAERLVASIMPDASLSFFAISMLILIFFVLRGGLVSIARFSEFFFFLFAIIVYLLFFLSLPDLRMKNLFPISGIDILPIFKSSYVMFGIWVYFLYVFFFGDQINDKEHIMKFGLQGALFLGISTMIVIIQTLGSLGPTVVERMLLPYFVSVKHISLLETVERLESVIIAFWIMADFIIIWFFSYIALKLAKSLFNLSESRLLVTPLVIFAYIFSLYLAKNRFELETFSSGIGLPINIMLGFVFPLVLLIVGKIRKKV